MMYDTNGIKICRSTDPRTPPLAREDVMVPNRNRVDRIKDDGVKINLLECTLEERDVRNEAVYNELLQVRAEKGVLSGEKQDLDRQLGQANNDLTARQQALDAASADLLVLRGRVATAENDLADAQANAAGLQAELARVNPALAGAEAEVIRLQLLVDAAHDQVEALQVQVQAEQANVAAANTQIGDLTQDLQDAVRAATELSKQRIRLSNQIGDLTQDLQDADLFVNVLSRKRIELSNTVEKANEQIGVLKAQAAIDQPALAAAKAQGIIDKTELAAAAWEIKELKEKLAAAEANSFTNMARPIFVLAGSAAFAYAVYSNPVTVVNFGLRSIESTMSFEGLNAIALGYGREITVGLAGLLGGTAGLVLPSITHYTLKVVNILCSILKKIAEVALVNVTLPLLEKVMNVTVWIVKTLVAHRNKVLAMVIIGLLMYYPFNSVVAPYWAELAKMTTKLMTDMQMSLLDLWDMGSEKVLADGPLYFQDTVDNVWDALAYVYSGMTRENLELVLNAVKSILSVIYREVGGLLLLGRAFGLAFIAWVKAGGLEFAVKIRDVVLPIFWGLITLIGNAISALKTGGSAFLTKGGDAIYNILMWFLRECVGALATFGQI